MKREVIVSAISLVLCGLPVLGQEKGHVPIYRVTVIQRSVDAINYEYRPELPTTIDFVGTVLLPKAKGEANVESTRGRTEIQAKFDHLEAPSRFGREYLTYVLWAITPEGRPHNVGELVADAGDKSKVHVTTDLQAFGLIVTAEPYSAVRQPSDVVVLENRVRPGTAGKIEAINAKYELMPRGHYTWQEPNNMRPPDGPKVSMDRYEALLELYQAQNAIGIARVASADQYAPNTLAKAEQLYTEAKRLDQFKGSSKMVVQYAREAAQTAEDARAIGERRREDEKVARLQSDASLAQQAKAQADADAARARSEADAARAQADAERAAREQAEADAAAARERAALAEAAAASRTQTTVRVTRTERFADVQATSSRMRLLEQLNGVLVTRDTPRGLVLTVPDADFSGSQLKGGAVSLVSRAGSILAAQRGLRIQVEGYTDTRSPDDVSGRRAEAVQGVLLGAGLPPNTISTRGLGDSRPLTSNSTPAGRIENRRVEIVVQGDAIGSLPYWDHAYSVSPKP